MQEDTIAAISTPLGEGGIGIVRMSGPQALMIAEAIFHPSGSFGVPLSHAASYTLHYGFIVAQGEKIDEVLVSVMRAPHTYTREDVVEINCHGGIVALRAVLDLVLEKGARLAEAGEFTKRAFLNGRISLDQAKAVLEIVRARTKLGLEAAVDQLSGRFFEAIAAIRERIGELLAEVEVEIDFPDVKAETEDALPALIELSGRIAMLLTQGEQGRIVREGLTIAIIGRPNVGKSTLLNTLLVEERAIVTPIPGTTRDTVEEEAAIGGVPVRFIDTAGLREPTDLLEEEGVRRTRAAIERADLLLLILDRSVPLTKEDQRLLESEWEMPAILVLNKCDLPREIGSIEPDLCAGTYEISAKSGKGVDRLTEGILDLLLGGQLPRRGAILLLDTWERDLLRRTKTLLDRTIDAVRTGCSLDMIAEELRAAYTVAGELQGIDVSEDILDRIFSRFCVGK